MARTPSCPFATKTMGMGLPSLPHSHTSKSLLPILLLLLLLLLPSLSSSELSPSQFRAIHRLNRLLQFPPALAALTNTTDPCYLPPSPSLSISCSGIHITLLSVSGDRPVLPDRSTALPPPFTTEALFAALKKLPHLTSLSLVSLGIWGPLPAKLDRLPSLQLLNLSSNYLYGPIPPEISTMNTLQNLVLSTNSLNGTVPDLSNLTLLVELDLDSNQLGPDFPSVGSDLTRLILSNNSFHATIPETLIGLSQLQVLDLSYNQFTGWIPPFLFSLPSIHILDLSNNSLTGQLLPGLTCADGLELIDISNNQLIGSLPLCIASNSSGRVVLFSWNCLNLGVLSFQYPNSYCNQGALAAALPPLSQESASSSSSSKNRYVLIGGIFGGVAVIGLLIVLVFRRARSNHHQDGMLKKQNTTKPLMHASPAEKRHASHAAKVAALEARVAALEAMPYRVFTFEEIEEATNNFDQSYLIKDGAQEQHFKGWLQDGSMVLVRNLKLKQNYPIQSLVQYMQIVSKLQHRHLVSIIGHCIVNGQGRPKTASSVLLVSECILNGNLRSHLSERKKRVPLKWPQRVAAAIGITRGIQHLHTIAIPGIVGNDIKIKNVLLDHTLTAKVSNYNLPSLPNHKNKAGSESPFAAMEDTDLDSIHNLEEGAKEDIYQLGLILLEIITGKPTESKAKLDALKAQLQHNLTEPEKLKAVADEAIRGTLAAESLRTVAQIALNCVSSDPKERPSIDDVLWNLQYSVQVQDGWASSESLSFRY